MILKQHFIKFYNSEHCGKHTEQWHADKSEPLRKYMISQGETGFQIVC